MTSKAFELARLGNAYSDGALSNRNLIINGAMRVAQRGTSKTGITNGDSGYHTVDRFKFTEAGSPTYQFTMSQSTTAPDGFGHSLKMDCTTAQSSLAAGDGARLDYYVEAQDCQNFAYGTSSAKQLTLSFWVRSNKTGSYRVWFYQDDDGRSNAGSYTIDAANTWEHKSITITGDTTGIIDNDNDRGLLVSFALAVGTNFTSGTLPTAWEANVTANRFVGQTVNLADSTSNEWYITGVQLEVGDTDTPFEHRSYGDELARCQRYYYSITHDGTNRWGIDGLYSTGTGAALNFSWTHPTTMRTDPTFTAGESISDTTYYPRVEFMNIMRNNQSSGRVGIEFSSGTSKWDAEL